MWAFETKLSSLFESIYVPPSRLASKIEDNTIAEMLPPQSVPSTAAAAADKVLEKSKI
jgi:hypothetical protein